MGGSDWLFDRPGYAAWICFGGVMFLSSFVVSANDLSNLIDERLDIVLNGLGIPASKKIKNCMACVIFVRDGEGWMGWTRLDWTGLDEVLGGGEEGRLDFGRKFR